MVASQLTATADVANKTRNSLRKTWIMRGSSRVDDGGTGAGTPAPFAAEL
jgi:hypothetical protein